MPWRSWKAPAGCACTAPTGFPRAHVQGVLRRDGSTILRLTGDREIPVSRGYLADVKAAGLV